MPPVARQNDMTTGHPPFPPTTIMLGSVNVMCNNLGVARSGDMIVPHVDPSTGVPHAAPIAGGSGTVMVNNMPIARVGDPIGCGDTIAMGSGNVMAN